MKNRRRNEWNSSLIPSFDNYFLSIYCDMPWAIKVSKRILWSLLQLFRKTYQSANNISKHIKYLKKLKIFHKCHRKERHDLEGAGFEMRAGKDFSKKYLCWDCEDKKKAWEITCYLPLVKCSMKMSYFFVRK